MFREKKQFHYPKASYCHEYQSEEPRVWDNHNAPYIMTSTNIPNNVTYPHFLSLSLSLSQIRSNSGINPCKNQQSKVTLTHWPHVFIQQAHEWSCNLSVVAEVGWITARWRADQKRRTDVEQREEKTRHYLTLVQRIKISAVARDYAPATHVKPQVEPGSRRLTNWSNRLQSQIQAVYLCFELPSFSDWSWVSKWVAFALFCDIWDQ
jgi:hypothetical protein